MTSITSLLTTDWHLGSELPEPMVVLGEDAGAAEPANAQLTYRAVDAMTAESPADAGLGTLVVPDLAKVQRPLKLFGSAFELLRAQGYLVVSGLAEMTAAHVLDHYRELPRQFGFLPVARFDIPESDGRKRCVAVYRKAEEAGARVVHSDFVSTEALLALFKACFDTAMSPAVWDWKYAEGRGEGVVLLSEAGAPVGHYGGITRDIAYFHSPARAAQVGDVMVLPSERGILKRHGAFYRMMTAYSEAQVGYGTPHLLGVGFPNTRHMRLAERLGLYASVDTMIEFRWPAKPEKRLFGQVIEEITGDGERRDIAFADTLWRRMQRDFADSVIGLRDGRYLRRRFLRHPDRPYRVWRVYSAFGARRLGLIVTKEQRDWWEVLDLIGGKSDLPRLLRAALSLKPADKGLKMWVSHSHAPLVEVGAPERHDPGVVIPNSSWSPGPSREELRGKWWLTGGDTDFR